MEKIPSPHKLCDRLTGLLSHLIKIDWNIYVDTPNRGAVTLLDRQEPNYWKLAESLHEDGATSPSVTDTFQ